MSDDANKVDAWMPLWIGAYLADTMTLTTQQHGAYLLLLFAYWRNRGPLDDDDEDLASVVKASSLEWKKLRPKLERFFIVADGRWSHKRADDELQKAGIRKAAAVTKAQAAAEARWAKTREQSSSNAPGDAPSIHQALLKDCPTPSPEEKVSKPSASHPPGGGRRFDDFWLTWPKNERKQDKAKCLDHWKRHGLDAIAETILVDVRTKRGTTKWQDGFIEAPLVYLRGKRWEDGVTPDEGRPGERVAEWHDSVAGIRQKGIELGIGDWTEALWAQGKAPDYPTYRARVFNAAGHSPRAAA